MATVKVARGTTMRFHAGRVVHLLTNLQGVEYLLFLSSEIHTETFDPFVLNGLSEMSIPLGWNYSSEVLSSVLVVTTPDGVARVFSVPDYWT